MPAGNERAHVADDLDGAAPGKSKLPQVANLIKGTGRTEDARTHDADDLGGVRHTETEAPAVNPDQGTARTGSGRANNDDDLGWVRQQDIPASRQPAASRRPSAQDWNLL